MVPRLSSQGYFVIPQPRPYEPNIFSVCACDFGDNFWLHLIAGLLNNAPNGFHSHAPDSKLHKWLASVQCNPWPIEPIDTVVSNAVGGSPYWDDYRFGKRYHFTDMWIREDFEYNPRIGLATRAACFPGRILLSLICAHQALLPATQGKEVRWSVFAEHLQRIQELLPTAVGRETSVDLGHLRDSDEESGCAPVWPWAPIFAGRRLHRLKGYVDRLMAGGINPSMPWLASYPEPFKMSPAEHGRINPYLQACVPMSECWPFGYRARLTDQEQCEYCCNPAHGGSGDPSCFDATYTFQRCCTPPGGQRAPPEATTTTTTTTGHGGDPSCFDAQFTFEFCCGGIRGNPACFDAVHTFDRCCAPPVTTTTTTTTTSTTIAFEGDPSCFDAQFTFQVCCVGTVGNPACFDAVYTFQRCCQLPAVLPAPAAVPPPTATPLPVDENCIDDNQFCNDWAKRGECEKNRVYMLWKCRKACGAC